MFIKFDNSIFTASYVNNKRQIFSLTFRYGIKSKTTTKPKDIMSIQKPEATQSLVSDHHDQNRKR